jgi:transposase
MMGLKERAFAPQVSVSLEELVPQDNFYRHLQKVLDLSFVYDLVRSHYATIGRPSIDPVVFFKLQLIMFFEDIRSERLLMRQVADRLSVRWYLGYDFDETLPDHSSLTNIRLRYGLPVFRRFFEALVEQCQQANLVRGKELFFDSTQVNANADLDSLTPRFAVEAREAMEAHLNKLFAGDQAESENSKESSHDDVRLAQYSPENPQLPKSSLGSPVNPLPQPEEHWADDAAKLESSVFSSTSDLLLPKSLPEKTFVPDPVPFPATNTPALRKELEAKNATRHDWIGKEGRQQREVAGKYQRTADIRVSTTDPDATPMRLKSGGIHLGYHTHYVVDGGKSRIIMAVLVVPGEVMDNQPMLDLLWHVCFRWKLRPKQVVGDTKYGTIENIKAVEDAHIRAYFPLPDWEHMTPYYGPSQFIYDHTRDCYHCPQGQLLRPFCRSESREQVGYRADPATCNACPVKAKCTESNSGRQLHRSFYADYLERVKGYHQTFAYQKAMNKRQVWVEPLFGEAKEWHGMRRFRLRRLQRVNCEALMTASGQNLKRLLRKRGWRRRPFPTEAMIHQSPPGRKTDGFLGHNELESERLGVAVASFDSSSPMNTFFATQMSTFFRLKTFLHDYLHPI